MSVTRVLPVALSLAATLAATPLAAQNWELLGTRRVSFRAEKDIIPVTGQEGRFKALMLEVEGGNLEMYNIRVVFGDGSGFSPETRLEFRQGSWSRYIDLPGDARVIRRIEFLYRSELRRGHATIKVYGRATATPDPFHPAGPTPAPVPAPAAEPRVRFSGWEHLGQRQVSFRAERDVISAAGEGRFHKIMIVVDDADLEIFNVRLVFGNGDTFSPKTRFYFREGSRTRVIDLPGDARVIRRIEFHYKSVRGGGDGRAEVHVYAQ
jgi:hypothetical protein